ncbi:MAG: hypothetical protein K5675_07990 [Lachnospiraceae bacterium]|nr:hypothetical protein [Lachnospiraceae bacterium]
MERVVNTAALSNTDLSEEVLYGLFFADVALEEVPLDYIEGGLLGLSVSDSGVEDNKLYLRVNYNISYPLKLLGTNGVHIYQQRCARIWNGYDPNQNKEDESYVYVAKYGQVYHESRYCSYINPSISCISRSEIKNVRNADGERYKKCPYCKGSGEYCYITTWGERYHSDLSCSALKRTVYRMKKSEAMEKYDACSKCGH